MLTHTFCHIEGIGCSAERLLWKHGIIHWNDYERVGGHLFSSHKDARIRERLQESRTALQNQDANYFLKKLPLPEHVRILPDFRDKMVFLDIETTGLFISDEITSIILYDGRTIKSYIKDKNFQTFPADIKKYSVLVTYNGKKFDLPFLRRTFGLPLTQAHVDLYLVLRALGYHGGLKSCERQMGIRREKETDFTGQDAVILWRRYQIHKDMQALRSLLYYNAQDALSLQLLIVKTYNLCMKHCPIFRPIPQPVQPSLHQSLVGF